MKLFFVAGEASGDRHAADLIQALTQKNPSLQVTALGGPKMQAAGATLIYDLTSDAVVGLVEVIRHLPKFHRIFNHAIRTIEADRPDAVVLVDYPGFNLRFAKEMKRRGIKVIYYISPQIWAWGKERLSTIRDTVDLMLVFFPFEEEMYKKEGVPALWVGHPLLDQVKVTQSAEEALAPFGGTTDQQPIALLPGSRSGEIRTLLPILKATAEQMAKALGNVRFFVMQAPGIPTSVYQEILGSSQANVTLVPQWDDNILSACRLGIVASGTSTLECALLGLPMVIVYKTNPITWWLGKRLVKLPYIGLVNILAGKHLIPECLQNEATPDRIASQAARILKSESEIYQLKEGLRSIKEGLGQPGAPTRAAQSILALLK